MTYVPSIHAGCSTQTSSIHLALPFLILLILESWHDLLKKTTYHPIRSSPFSFQRPGTGIHPYQTNSKRRGLQTWLPLGAKHKSLLLICFWYASCRRWLGDLEFSNLIFLSAFRNSARKIPRWCDVFPLIHVKLPFLDSWKWTWHKNCDLLVEMCF